MARQRYGKEQTRRGPANSLEVYGVMPVRKVETMRPVSAVVDELVVALASGNQ